MLTDFEEISYLIHFIPTTTQEYYDRVISKPKRFAAVTTGLKKSAAYKTDFIRKI